MDRVLSHAFKLFVLNSQNFHNYGRKWNTCLKSRIPAKNVFPVCFVWASCQQSLIRSRTHFGFCLERRPVALPIEAMMTECPYEENSENCVLGPVLYNSEARTRADCQIFC